MPNAFNIIHLCEDEKFINSALEQFEYCFPGQNTFYVLTYDQEKDLKYIKASKIVHKISIDNLAVLAKKIPDNIYIVLHSLPPGFYSFVQEISRSIPLIWICFGFEVYKDPKFYKEEILLDKLTIKLFPPEKATIGKKIKDFSKVFFRFFNDKVSNSEIKSKKEAIKRINYLGTSFDEEFDQICQLINQKKEKFTFWYFPIEIIIDIKKTYPNNKSNLLIGNSGFVTLNHFDVFHKIEQFNLDNLNVVVPLNYGKQKYINEVLSEGRKIFKDRFNPILDFMPLDEYNNVLGSVGVAILNNRRQQAIGNTIGLLWFGAKVFLSEKNTFFKYLRRISIIVFSYEKELNEKSLKQFLTNEEIEHNRKILYKELNREHLSKLLRKQFLQIVC
jgi:hypothetical protein